MLIKDSRFTAIDMEIPKPFHNKYFSQNVEQTRRYCCSMTCKETLFIEFGDRNNNKLMALKRRQIPVEMNKAQEVFGFDFEILLRIRLSILQNIAIAHLFFALMDIISVKYFFAKL